MNFIKLKCVNQNVDLNDYLKLYTYVKENMQHPEWLGTFSMNNRRYFITGWKNMAIL